MVAVILRLYWERGADGQKGFEVEEFSCPVSSQGLNLAYGVGISPAKARRKNQARFSRLLLFLQTG
jgi:hypothetical protein